ncbi:MAG: hypothetical protein OXK80_02585 [Bdellovibrionales bacterium]|nr:hypothetical protein [Bdellovibrionales bacterium]
MKFLFFFLSVFLTHCNLFTPQPITSKTSENGSDEELIKLSICHDVDTFSSCTSPSASTPKDLLACKREFSKILRDTLDEIDNSQTNFSLTPEEERNFNSALKRQEDCISEPSAKVDSVGSDDELQEVHEDILSCVEGFTSSVQDIMKCDLET